MSRTAKIFCLFFCFLFLLLVGLSAAIAIVFRPLPETKRVEMTRIPKEIKRKINYASPSATFRVPILLYHYVEYVKDKGDTIRQSLDIVPKTFEEQVKTLSEAGYTFMTASDLADVFDGIKPLPQKPIMLTFDDGHWDLYTDVLPILEKYHVKATAYIISGFIGNSDFLSKEQLQKVIDSNLVEIGAHTVHHVPLAHRLLPLIQYEIGQSKKQLEDGYHIKVVSFAYPGGSFDQQAIDVVKSFGFRTSVSTLPGVEQSQTDRFYLYRIRSGYRTGKSLLDYLNQQKFRPW